jgi:hypothetical protein
VACGALPYDNCGRFGGIAEMSAERSFLAARYKRLEEKGVSMSRRTQIVMAEAEALRRRSTNIFDLLKDDDAAQERLMRGPKAFQQHELSFIAEVE